MIAGRLLARGMIAGCLAAALAFAFARIFGEPQVALAIAFEAARSAAEGITPEPELVSRSVQASYGLATATLLYGVGFGGLFALVFSFAYGRLSISSPRVLALLLAVAGFVTVVLVPDLKYPPNPPAVGNPASLALRTETYFVMIALSICVAAIACLIGQKAAQMRDSWTGWLCGGAVFILLVALVQFGLPDVNEVPDGFPAVVLWRFREAALGMQCVLWGSMGLIFGALATPLLATRARS
ncbi:hypothetical protein AA0473_0192 [Acetobacter orleanensis NRIC 0473]|nr:hypothetical protein AA0473_0192 [Acetobacter orleanensis NRIC 0473]